MPFDPNKYRQIAQKEFGPNAFNFSNLSNTGSLQAHAEQLRQQLESMINDRMNPKKTYQDAVNYIAQNKDQFLNIGNDPKHPKPTGAYQIANEIRNDPAKQAQIKAQGYNVSDYINALYAGLSGGNFRSEREYNQHVSQQNKDLKANPYVSSELRPQKQQKQPKKSSSHNLFGDLLNRVERNTANVINSAGLGIPNWLAEHAPKALQNVGLPIAPGINVSPKTMINAQKPSTTTSGKVMDTLSNLAGYAVPGELAVKGAKLLKAGKGAEKGLQALGAGSKLAKLGGLSAEGAVSGGLFGVGQQGVDAALHPNSQTLKQRMANVGFDIGLGLVGDPLLHGAGKLLGKLKGSKPEVTAPKPLALPEGKVAGYLPEGQKQLPPPMRLNEPMQIDQPSGPAFIDGARREKNPYTVKFEKLVKDFNDLKAQGLIPPGREEEVAVEMWNNMAGPHDPSFEQMLHLANDRPMVTPQQKPELIQQARKNAKAPVYGIDNIYGKLKLKQPMERASMQYVGNIKNPIALRAETNPDVINQLRSKLNPNQEVAATKQFENISPQKSPKMAKVQEPTQTNFTTQDEAFNSFRNKVDRTPKKQKDGSLYQKLHTNLVDDLSPLLNLEKSLSGGKVNSAENSLYKTARLFRGSPEKANHIVDNELLPIIKNVEDKGYSYKDLGDYALAMHAKDVNAKGINSGFSNQEIQATINKLQSPVLENARQQLLGLSNKLLDEMQKADLISKDAVDTMRNKWPNYMPLFRSFEDNKVNFHSGLGKALANASSPINKLEGSNRKVIDPLESMVKNIYQATNAIDRNGIGKQLANLAGKDTEQQFIRKLAPNEDAGRKNVVSVMENGKKVKYEVPPDVYKTMMNLDKESSNLLINLLRKPASVLRAGATLTPEFSLRNPMRDINQAFAVSQSGFNPIVDFPVGLWQSIFKGKTIKIGGKEFKTSGDLYKQFIQDNGGYGNIVSMDRQMHRKALEKVIKEGNTNKFVNIINPKSYINLLRTIADVSETATKLGEYRAALRSGASRQEAAYRARDIMDFGRAGASIRETNKVVAFLNANIQGKSKLIRAIKENPMKVLSKMAVTSTLPSVGAFVAAKYLANDQQKKVIDDAPKWLKDSFWLVPIPFTNQVARVPKPFDIAPIFSNIPEKAMEYAYNNDKHAFDGFAKELLSSYSIPVMLTGITPIIEGMANYSFFRQGPIIPQRENNVSFPDQYDINTPELSKAIAKGVNKLTGGEGMFKNFGSPRVIDNTISGFTGGMGNYANNFIDWILSSTGAVDKGEKPSKQINQQPLLRSFLVNQSSTGESMNKLYDLRDKLTRQKGSSKEHNTLFNNAPQYQLVNSATSKIGKISSQMRVIQNSQSLSGQQKRTELDKLNSLRNKIAIDTMKTLNR